VSAVLNSQLVATYVPGLAIMGIVVIVAVIAVGLKKMRR